MNNDLLHPKPDAPRLALRQREAAEAIGVSPRTLWSWTQSGDVPHIRRGKTILYPVEALRRWLNKQATQAAAESDRGGDE